MMKTDTNMRILYFYLFYHIVIIKFRVSQAMCLYLTTEIPARFPDSPSHIQIHQYALLTHECSHHIIFSRFRIPRIWHALCILYKI